MEWPRTRPLTRWSHMVRLYWWLLVLFPILTLLTQLPTGRRPRSADEAMGAGFFTIPFLLAAFLTAPALVYRAWISTAIERAERKILIGLGLAVVPLLFLIAA